MKDRTMYGLIQIILILAVVSLAVAEEPVFATIFLAVFLVSIFARRTKL